MNPLPELLYLLERFAKKPFETMVHLWYGFEGLDERVIQAFVKWAGSGLCAITELSDVMDETLGPGYGYMLNWLPKEFLERLEKACRELHEKTSQLWEKGGTLKDFIELLGREPQWLKRLASDA